MKIREVAKLWEILAFALCLGLGFSLLFFHFTGLESSLVRKGLSSFRKKDFSQAQIYFHQALAQKPFDPWLYMNLALAYDQLLRPGQALKNYSIVSSDLAKQSGPAVFFSYFNQGELNGRLGRLEEALAGYQKALEFRYKEKEIKKNIELLFKNKKSDQKKPERSQPDSSKKPSSDSQQEAEAQKEDSSQGEQKSAGEKQKDVSQSAPGENQGAGDKDSKSPPQAGGEARESEDPKSLSEKEERAILEEIEKQENKTKSKFYQRKKVFGDKARKDW